MVAVVSERTMVEEEEELAPLASEDNWCRTQLSNERTTVCLPNVCLPHLSSDAGWVVSKITISLQL